MLTGALIRKYNNLESTNFRRACPVCGKEIDPYAADAEYVRTKRKSDIFVHRACVINWGKDQEDKR